jgi:hypothetical protein
VAGLLAGGVVLSGCSEKQEANDSLPTASASPTGGELPPLGPEDLPMPDEARTQDAAGAEAFVRYYIDLINRTSETLDAEPLRRFSDACQECERVAANAEDSAQEGYRYEGGEITVTDITAPLLGGQTAEMAIRVDQAQLVVLDSTGGRVEQGSSDPLVGLSGSVGLTWDSALDSWLMTHMAFG